MQPLKNGDFLKKDHHFGVLCNMLEYLRAKKWLKKKTDESEYQSRLKTSSKLTYQTWLVGGFFPPIWKIFGCFQKFRVFTPQIIHLFIGFSLIITIDFGVTLFLETPISQNGSWTPNFQGENRKYLKPPPRWWCGKCTVSPFKSGVILGYLYLISGGIKRLKKNETRHFGTNLAKLNKKKQTFPEINQRFLANWNNISQT